MNKRMLRLALVQMAPEDGHPDRNERRVERLVREAAQHRPKPDIIVLPELWNTGYVPEKAAELADPDGRRTRERMSSLARECGIRLVAGSVAERLGDGRIVNAAYLFDEKGRTVGRYEKIHLFRPGGEHRHFAAGGRADVFSLGGVPVAVIVCYDLRFPELCRRLALQGTRVVFVPAAWPASRAAHWRLLLAARAVENQLFVAGCNRTGRVGNTAFAGGSAVFGPWGEAVAEAGDEECVVFAEIWLDRIEEARAAIPVWDDRRPDVY